MNATAPKTVADRLLPRLETLIQSRLQAHWQWRNCADENKHKWTMVLMVLDDRIMQGENLLGSTLDVTGFHMKRVIIE